MELVVTAAVISAEVWVFPVPGLARELSPEHWPEIAAELLLTAPVGAADTAEAASAAAAAVPVSSDHPSS